MKVICNRGALLEALTVCGNVVASRTPKPVLQCVKLSAADDRLTVSGGDQSLFAAAGARQQGDVTQVAVGNAVFSAGCRRNPTQGIAAVQKAGTEGGGMLLFTFHSTCDGRADVTGAMAPYALMLGESVPLDFLE